MLSLPPGTTNNPTTYRVLQPIEMVAKGTASSWFNQPGGGIQYYIGFLGRYIDKLLNAKMLEKVE